MICIHHKIKTFLLRKYFCKRCGVVFYLMYEGGVYFGVVFIKFLVSKNYHFILKKKINSVTYSSH